ncbi:Formyltransferase/hydrolase complex Fhc subunit C [Rubrivivax sp. A210]|uniref:formylmethanofuran dehydrogenase subunit C n=1 Tax=Rubrivivax sp. A210 TaxID=2772301 RepID=UPI0019194991|nr:formylmethanofuran dehydrogenase subunit C [Rubrivivax sp. A210]CAD5372154.1 Formyltransferase/hydrolase complex Fhc subunit C [Rubrivivax sp. A210]
MSVTLRLRQVPGLRLDLRGLTPAALAPLAAADIERLPVAQGNRTLPLAEFFDVSVIGEDSDRLVFEGDCSRCDRLAWQLDGGQVVVEGGVGDQAGGCMTAGTLLVRGSAGLLAGCEMAGGSLQVDGDVGDFAAASLPGSMDGMRGGSFIVRGSVGQRFGDRMRRGTAVIFGDAGDFLASRMVAGTIALAGRAGVHVGYGMRRGSVVFAGPAPEVPPTFVPAGAEALVFWQLLARDLARHGGIFAGLPARRVQRQLGDLAALGKGELILAL